MRSRPLILALIVAAIFAIGIAFAGGFVGNGPQPTNPIPATVASIDRGGQVYAENCAKCHGVDARGGGPLSGTTEVPPPALTGPSAHFTVHSDADLFQFISNGLPGGMPPWARTLSDQDIWNVINYLHSIQVTP